jgi:cytochrome c biogenesis protein ResB
MKRLWTILASTWLTIVLAACICIVAAWGSIITISNPEFFGSLDQAVLLQRLLNAPYGFRAELGLTHWVFALILLTFLFTVNTVVCTIDKLNSIIRNKRPVQALFPHIVHIGFLIAVTGHLVGSIWGFRSPGNVLYQSTPVPVPYETGLSIRLDGFEIERAPSGNIESLKTRVTLLEETGTVLSSEIEINGPLIYKGIAFYHMDQGSVPTGLVLEATRGGGTPEAERTTVDFGGSFTLKDSTRFALGDVYPDFALDARGRPYSRSPEFRNPYVEITSGGGQRRFLPVSYPGSTVTFDATGVGAGVAIRLVDYKMTPYVVLTINRDPGIWFIIIGSLVLVTGMALLLLLRGSRTELVRRADSRP